MAGTAAGGAIAAGAAASAAGAPTPTANASPAPSPGWSQDEIKQAKAHCDVVLRGVTASYAPDDPIKQGECGSPVVFKVTSIGKGPEVQLSPPPTMTCDMIASLEKWIRQDVQPQARALLGGSVVKIDSMSSYSCRNAYGRSKARLSEHGRANALDISAFNTAKESTAVLTSWGLTAREQRALAAKQEAERAAAQAGKAPASGQPQHVPPASAGAATGGLRHPYDMPGIVVAPPPSFGLAPVRLGGPKATTNQPAGGTAPQANPQAATKADPKQTFLREIHARACKHFGTVLGPEANNAHKNHFHVDMAPRKTSNFCE